MRLQIVDRVPPVVTRLFAALFRRSLAAEMHRRRLFSKFLVVPMVVARHPDPLLAAVSSSFGSMPAHLRFALRLSLYLVWGAQDCVFLQLTHRRKAGEGFWTHPFGLHDQSSVVGL